MVECVNASSTDKMAIKPTCIIHCTKRCLMFQALCWIDWTADLNASRLGDVTTEVGRRFQDGIVLGKKECWQTFTLQCGCRSFRLLLCLVGLINAGVGMYVTGTAIRPLLTLKRRTKSKYCRRCWRDGHWRVERMDVTLSGWCGLNGLLATNLAALRCICSICLICVCCCGFYIGAEYSNLGRTRVTYALSFTGCGHLFKLRLMNPRVCEAFLVIISI